MPFKVMLSAGEASGDMYGANLARKLRELAPGTELVGMGGEAMREAGVRILHDPTSMSTVGFGESLKNLPVLRRVLLMMGESLAGEKPDVLVLIDFPGFNMRLAEMASRAGIRTIYFLCPTVWAWGSGRARKVARIASVVASVFDLEAEVYREAGASVEFIGHPILDIVRPRGRAEARKALGIKEDGPIVGLLPGSRNHEIEKILPVMLKAGQRICQEMPEVRFVMALAPTASDETLRKAMRGRSFDVSIVKGLSLEVMEASSALMVGAGTATLEAAILGTPMAIVCRVSHSTWILGRMLLKIPYIGWPNILARRMIVPEFLQDKATPGSIASAVLGFLQDTESVRSLRGDLKEAISRLGSAGALERLAWLVIKVARGLE